MKYLLVAALSMFSVYAAAAQPAPPTSAQSAPITVQYDYSQHLDIAKVVSISPVNPDSCGPISSNMVYIDSKGVTHSLEYTRLGNGCENG